MECIGKVLMQHSPFCTFRGKVFSDNVFYQDQIGMGGSRAVILVIKLYAEAVLHAFQEVLLLGVGSDVHP